ncbi:MAG: PHP domain-containing protein [bacterium]
MHSRLSDGYYSPTELIKMAKAGGLELVSLTDHDSVSGIKDARQTARNQGCKFISGIELEAFIDHRGESYSIHILGYGINETNEELLTILKKIHIARSQRARKMVSKLNSLGIEIDLQEVLKFSHGDSVSRVHVAQALKEKGIVDHIDKAFYKYIGNNRPAYVPKKTHNPSQIIKLIHASGGIAVWAHPYYCDNDSLIQPLIAAGIDGIECFHREFDEKTVEHYLEMASRYNLIVTGGSDFHGTLEESFELGDWWFDFIARSSLSEKITAIQEIL